MTKMHDMAHPHGLCSGWCPDVVERVITVVDRLEGAADTFKAVEMGHSWNLTGVLIATRHDFGVSTVKG